MNFDDYEILKKLRKEFRNKVETAYVFGEWSMVHQGDLFWPSDQNRIKDQQF